MIVTLTNSARKELTKELKNNNVPFELISSIYKVELEESAKALMAIRLTKERCGSNCMTIVK
jgi:hypothetical protein